VRITAARKLVGGAVDNGLLAPESGGGLHSLIAQCLPFNSDCSLVNLSVLTVIHRSSP
jgi:hypothetical protein